MIIRNLEVQSLNVGIYSSCENVLEDMLFAETIHLLGDKKEILLALQELNETLSSTPDGSLFVAIVAAMSSVLAAFFFNLVYWAIIDERKRQFSEIAKFEVILDQFEKNGTEYWMYSYTSKKAKSILIKEMRLKTEHRLLRDCKKKIIKHIFRKKNKQKFQDKIDPLLSELYDSATGGDFETKKRKEDLYRCEKIILTCTKLRMLVTGVDV